MTSPSHSRGSTLRGRSPAKGIGIDDVDKYKRLYKRIQNRPTQQFSCSEIRQFEKRQQPPRAVVAQGTEAKRRWLQRRQAYFKSLQDQQTQDTNLTVSQPRATGKDVSLRRSKRNKDKQKINNTRKEGVTTAQPHKKTLRKGRQGTRKTPSPNTVHQSEGAHSEEKTTTKKTLRKGRQGTRKTPSPNTVHQSEGAHSEEKTTTKKTLRKGRQGTRKTPSPNTVHQSEGTHNEEEATAQPNDKKRSHKRKRQKEPPIHPTHKGTL